MTDLERLLDIAGPELATLRSLPETMAPVAPLLSVRNGFLAFESALLVPPFLGDGSPNCIAELNRGTWREDLLPNHGPIIFFGVDAFGDVFGIGRDGVVHHSIIGGTTEKIAQNLDGWANAILDDYDYLTGWSLAAEWQKQNRPLVPFERLMIYPPPALGGEFAIDRMSAVPLAEWLDFAGTLYQQIKDLPDGAQIDIEITD